MRGMHTKKALLATGMLTIAPTAIATDVPAIRYDITLHMNGEGLDAAELRATTRTRGQEMVDLLIPRGPVTDVEVQNGSLDTSEPGHWKLRPGPGGEIALTWRSARPAAWRTLEPTLAQSAIIRTDALVAPGPALLALPDGPDGQLAEVRWTVPGNWVVSTSIKEGTQNVGRLKNSTFLTARRAVSATQRSGDATIRVTALDPRRVDVAKVAEDIAAMMTKSVAPALRQDFTLNIVDLDGTGDGFALAMTPTGGTAYLPAAAPEEAWATFAMWTATIPDDTRIDPAFAWYTQGFTAFRVLHALRSGGHASPATLAYLLNDATTFYGNSPFRRVPNRRVVEDFAGIREMHDLPAARGELFALLLDARIRSATGGARSLADALDRLDGGTLSTGAAGEQDPAPALIEAVAAVGGGDIAPLYHRYIVDGQLLQLPPDALGLCYTIGTVADWAGWEVQHVFAKASCSGKR
mgnify:FL=1